METSGEDGTKVPERDRTGTRERDSFALEFAKRMRTEQQNFRFVNDNGQVWPLIPFPDGWHAAC